MGPPPNQDRIFSTFQKFLHAHFQSILSPALILATTDLLTVTVYIYQSFCEFDLNRIMQYILLFLSFFTQYNLFVIRVVASSVMNSLVLLNMFWCIHIMKLYVVTTIMVYVGFQAFISPLYPHHLHFYLRKYHSLMQKYIRIWISKTDCVCVCVSSQVFLSKELQLQKEVYELKEYQSIAELLPMEKKQIN